MDLVSCEWRMPKTKTTQIDGESAPNECPLAFNSGVLIFFSGPSPVRQWDRRKFRPH